METITTKSPTFSELPYRRPDFEQLQSRMETALGQLNSADQLEDALHAIADIQTQRNAFLTMYNLAYIRHSIDTTDAYYEVENAYYDEHLPLFEALKARFYEAILQSPWRAGLEENLGRQLFAIAELSLKAFDPAIIEDLQEENRLISAYNKLKATAAISFDGEVYNLSSIQKLEVDTNRDLRRRAAQAKWDWLAAQQPEMDRIFDELVAVRHKMALRLGFDNFVPLGYARMLRTDYDASMVARFREQIRAHFVPLANALQRAQAARLGLTALFYYDEGLQFPGGNPQPQGNPDWIVEQAATMYAELSDETNAFFQFMQEGELMDLIARDGKATGGYCTYIQDYKAPFIFSNFNGTSADIDVLTHEAGHAFQVYESRNHTMSEYNWPTFEACEIHSMSMEFFTWPWMPLFFKEAAGQYYQSHLGGTILFLPYGCAVDEFQHHIYTHPTLSPQERHSAWKQIEEKYLPQRQYDGHSYLEAGGFWQKQSHIYNSPFYYIDYVLAQICAFQFWIKDRENHQLAWADYVRLCQAGGSAAFLDLVRLANLRSPFDDGIVAQLAKAVGQWLESDN